MRGICIDLGTSTTSIAALGRDEMFTEPSVVTINIEDNIIIDAGADSKEALGKTPEHLIAIKPLSGGVIADYSAAEGMVKLLVKKAFNRTIFTGISAIVSVPSSATQMERRAAIETVKNLGITNVNVIEETMASAIGSGINVLTPTGNMVVNIGGGTTDIAVIALGHIATGICSKDGGDSIDNAIIAYVKRRYNITIGENTAERIKIDLGCAIPKEKNSLGTYMGRDGANNLPKAFTVTSEEIREAMADVLNTIADNVVVALEKTPPELLSDVMETGIIITGGGANIYGIEELFIKKTGFKTIIANNPDLCTLRGEMKALSDKKMKRLWKSN